MPVEDKTEVCYDYWVIHFLYTKEVDHIKIFSFAIKLISDTKISHKFMMSVIFIVAIPMLIINYTYYNKLQQGISDEIGLSFQQVANQYTSNINYKISMYMNILDNITVNGVIQEALVSQDEVGFSQMLDMSRDFSVEIEAMISARNYIEINNITLYALNEYFPTDGRYISNFSFIKNEKWYKDMLDKGEYNYCFSHTEEWTKAKVVSLVRPIVDLKGGSFNRRLGLARLDLKSEELFKTYEKKVDQTDKDIYVFDNTGGVIYWKGINNPDYLESVIKEMEFEDVFTKEFTLRSFDILRENKILISRKLDNYGWTAVFLFHRNKIENKINEANRFIFSVLIIDMVILLLLTLMFLYFFSQRIHFLIKKMRKVSAGNLEITERLNGKDEIGELDENFNSMVEKLKQLINENYLKSLEKKEAELYALQVQINPHFLYNTLESINAISSIYGCDEVCKISQTLGDMFRYSMSIGSGEFVRLDDEIQHIKNYLYIQKIRYGEMFDPVFDIPDSLKKCRVLKFILQPFIENSLYHGFKDKIQKGFIEIIAFVEDGTLVIKIQDDGAGISQERLEELYEYINESRNMGNSPKKRNIGIKNVNMRIKLACGDNYGVTIFSKENAWTQVLVRIPLLGEMEEVDDV